MGDEKGGPDPVPAGPSSVEGTFSSLKNRFDILLTANSLQRDQDLVVFGEKEFEEWKDLSSLLQPGAKLEERANALAFVVKQCLRLLDERQFHTLADNTGYGPMHCSCFTFYAECLAAMDIFNARAAWLCSMRMSRDIGPENDGLLAKQIQHEMEQATFCMARCWSVIRSEGGTLVEASTTVEGKLHGLVSKLDEPQASDVDVTVIEFCRMGLQYVARLSRNILEGMATTAKLLLDEKTSEDKFKECVDLVDSLKGGVREKSLKTLQDIFVRVKERHDSAMKIAALQKLPDTDAAKQLPGKNKVDDSLKKGLGSGIWSIKFKSLAAEMVSAGEDGDAGHVELFSAMWQSDIDSCSIGEDYFTDAANRLLFSVVAFSFAVPIYLKYVDASLGPDAAGTAEVEEGIFVKTMNIRLKSIRPAEQESSPEKSIEEVAQEIAEVGKKSAEGKGTPTMTSREKNRSGGTPQKKDSSQSSSQAEHGRTNVRSTPPKTGGSQSSSLKKVADSQQGGNRKKVGDPEKDPEDDRKAQSSDGLSSEATSSVTALSSLGHPTQADLDQVQDDFVIKCSLAEVKDLLHNYAQEFQRCMGNGDIGSVSQMVFDLDIPKLQEVGLYFSTGHQHPGIERFTSDLPRLVKTLAGLSVKGSYMSLVEDMCKRFEGARVLAAGVTSLGKEATSSHLKDLGFATLKFNIASCRLLKDLQRKL